MRPVEAHGISRRSFLGTAALTGGALLLGLGCPGRKGASAPSRGLRLVFFTDVHARTEWGTPEAMMKAAAAINAAGPDLVIAGGDLITDGFQSSAESVEPRWDVYMRMHEAIEARVEPVLGNHDLVAAIPEDGTPPAEDPRAVFKEKFGLERTYRSFDFKGYHFILLDSTYVLGGRLKYHGYIWPEQMEWIKRDLATVEEDTPVVVVSHMPLLTTIYQSRNGMMELPPEHRVVTNSKDVLDLFGGRNLLLVLQGHLHMEEVILLRGATFITGGAVCGRWWRGSYYGTEEGFWVLDLVGNQVGWDYVEYGWEARRPKDQ